MDERIVHINYEQLKNAQFNYLFETPRVTEIVYKEYDTKWVLRFYPPNTKFLFIATVLKNELLKEISDVGYHLTTENVDAKFTEFKNRFLIYGIEDKTVEEIEVTNDGLSIN